MQNNLYFWKTDTIKKNKNPVSTPGDEAPIYEWKKSNTKGTPFAPS